MAEWVDRKDQGLRLISLGSGYLLMVYEPGKHNGARRTCWTMNSPCICTGWDELPLEATTAEAAKLEALTLVGEWAKSLATRPAGSEVRITIPGASEPVDIIGLDVDPDFDTSLLEADSPEFDTDDDEELEDKP